MLSDNIKILRKKKGYSQETLAEQLHVKNLVLYHTEEMGERDFGSGCGDAGSDGGAV